MLDCSFMFPVSLCYVCESKASCLDCGFALALGEPRSTSGQ